MSATIAYAGWQIESGAASDSTVVETKMERLEETGGKTDMAPIPAQGSSDFRDRLQLGTVFDSRFRVRRSIPVEFERTEDGVSAIWQEIDEFGHAASGSEAVVELARGLVELYQQLFAERTNLGLDMERVWNLLQSHIETVRP